MRVRGSWELWLGGGFLLLLGASALLWAGRGSAPPAVLPPVVAPLPTPGPALPDPRGGCWTVFTWPAADIPAVHWQDLRVLPGGALWLAGWLHSAGTDRALVAHWDGHRWTQDFLSPDAASHFSGLVAATSGDVWVTGTVGSEPRSSIFVHWDGRHWHQLPPLPGHQISSSLPEGSIHVVTALLPAGAGELWVFGTDHTGPHAGETVYWQMHWDGSAWHEEPWLTGSAAVPRPPGAQEPLDLLAAPARADLWVASGQRRFFHWDGQAWHVLPPLPALRTDLDLLTATVGPAGDLWISGELSPPPAGTSTLTAHWDGAAWQVIPPSAASISAVAAGSATLWAVGTQSADTPMYRMWAGHWTGQSWESLSVPVVTERSKLTRLAGGSADGLWMLGQRNIAPEDPLALGESVLLHYTSTVCGRLTLTHPPLRTWGAPLLKTQKRP